MNKLPEKWCIKTENNDNGTIIGKWFTQQSSHVCYSRSCLGEYYHSHNLNGQSILNKDWLIASFANSTPRDGYTEITFEQFKQHIMKKLPENWFIQVTEENQDIVSKWRLSKATNFHFKTKIDIGLFVMSNHRDGSYYFGGELKSDLLEDYPNYQEIDLQTFLQITEMKKTTYTVTREQFLEGYELACGNWKETLTNKFSIALIKSDTIEVEDEFVQELRGAASNESQREFLNKLFPNPNLVQCKDLEIGEAMKIVDDGKHNGKIILKTYDQFVDIHNPRHTWSGTPSFSGVRVKLKIEVEEC